MKKILLTLSIAIASYFSSFAQWSNGMDIHNATNGNVGIGTTSPAWKLTTNTTSNTGSWGSNFYSDYYGMHIGVNSTSSSHYAFDVQSGMTSATDGSDHNVLFRILNSGNVGIGTTNPSQPLTIPIVSNAKGISLGTYSSLSAGQFAFVGITGADGTFNSGNLTGGDNGSTGMAIVHTSGGIGNSAELAFVTHNNGFDSRERVRIDRLGNVGIGTISPDAKLAVNGTIHSKEVKVDMTGWSDYVFEPTYDLPSLASVKTYIDKNRRLPEMPSTQEVLKNGVNLGEMVNLQMKKIEELTLYLIEKDKQVIEQRQINQSLQERIEKIERFMSSKTLPQN